MLSEREQQVLEDIERHLVASDPQLAATLVRATRPARWWIWALAALGWVVTIGSAVAGWWIVTVLLLGPLTAVTLAWLLNATALGRYSWR